MWHILDVVLNKSESLLLKVESEKPFFLGKGFRNIMLLVNQSKILYFDF